MTTPWTICVPALPSAAKFSLIVYFRPDAESPLTVWRELLSPDKLCWTGLVWDLCCPTPQKDGLTTMLADSQRSVYRLSNNKLTSVDFYAKWLRASHRCLDVPCCAQHTKNTNGCSSLLNSSENNPKKMSEIPFFTRTPSQPFKKKDGEAPLTS